MTDPKRLLCFLNVCRTGQRPAEEDLPPELAAPAAALFAAFDAMEAEEVADQCRVLSHLAFPDDIAVPLLRRPEALPAAYRIGDVAAVVDAQVEVASRRSGGGGAGGEHP